MDHLRRIRIHTRLPIVIPERVTDAFLGWLTGSRLVPIVVVHANHAQEIDAAVECSFGRIRDAGVPVLNQAVLLSGVNDCIQCSSDLCERLINIGVTPYYLHLLDPVAGAVALSRARRGGASDHRRFVREAPRLRRPAARPRNPRCVQQDSDCVGLPRFFFYCGVRGRVQRRSFFRSRSLEKRWAATTDRPRVRFAS